MVIEPHKLCQHDRISVENGKSTFTTCGNEEPHPITSVANRMVVTFETDGNGDFRGFKAMVSVAEPGKTIVLYFLQAFSNSIYTFFL